MISRFKYDLGDGVSQDYKKAMKWYRLAPEQGVVGAQVMLGILYERGHGVLQDNATAHMWYQHWVC